MNTALLLFAIWLIGVLITAIIVFRALRAKCTATVFDHVAAFCVSSLSWLFLIPLVCIYIVKSCKSWRKKMEAMWQRIDDWWRSR